jgi:CheY-like chemotaxis protein
MLHLQGMDSQSTPELGGGMSADEASQASSELNNLLQVIAGAMSMLDETPTENTPTYKTMLRESVQRAEKLAEGLAAHAGGTSRRSLTQADATYNRSGSDLASGNPAKQSIMVVDDEKMGLILMNEVLTRAGFDVVMAQSGFECLEQFRLRPFGYSLVLLDLTMPFMDGEETFSRLKDIRSDVPVLLCTGFIQQERLDRLMLSGLAGFLRKPIAPDEIVALVRRSLAELRYSRDAGPRGFSAAM